LAATCAAVFPDQQNILSLSISRGCYSWFNRPVRIYSIPQVNHHGVEGKPQAGSKRERQKDGELPATQSLLANGKHKPKMANQNSRRVLGSEAPMILGRQRS